MKERQTFYRYLAEIIADSPWQASVLSARLNRHIKPEGCLDEWLKSLVRQHPQRITTPYLLPFLKTDTTLLEQMHLSGPYFRVIPLVTSKSELINQQMPSLNTEADLGHWLGWDSQMLSWYMDRKGLSARCGQPLHHYRTRCMAKRRGGYRVIEAPKRQLKKAQNRINESILQYLPVSEVCFGFVRGRNCLQHAHLHEHQAIVLGFDIEDCFLSVNGGQVYRAFRYLGYSNSAAKALMALCTHHQSVDSQLKDMLSARQQRLLTANHLPQGAPTSPALANFALLPVDKRLSAYFHKMGSVYSRYADDMVISGGRHLHKNFARIHARLGSVLLEEGFKLNYRKSKCMSQAARQQVTGITVNQFANISRSSYDQLKAELHNCVCHGWASQTALAENHYHAHLLGRINHVRLLNSAKASKLSEKFRRINWSQ
jgi:RNA-directed DNA polymerase